MPKPPSLTHLPRRPRLPHRLQLPLLALVATLAAPPALQAATEAPAAKPAPRPAAQPAAAPRARPAPRPATPRQQLKSEAEGLALATSTVDIISQAQLDVAARVLTGAADCEFKQQVTVQPVENQPGHFHVGFKGQRYTMVPEETATGAVRLQDRRAGMVWLQIPTKSMLMNSRLGQRVVDGCLHAEQRAAVTAAAAAGAGLGIVPPAAAPAAPAPAASSAAMPEAAPAAAPAASR